jgi:poly-beta-1,6-N-acetyl-D-glucosamine synthase
MMIAFLPTLEVLAVLVSVAVGVVSLQGVWLYTAFRRNVVGRAGALHLLNDVDGAITAGRQQVTVLVPAHNEQECIQGTILGLLRQTVAPDLIVVIADNCTDKTVERANLLVHANPRLVLIETIDNDGRKAGALNQGWHEVSAFAGIVVQVDADTHLASDAIEQALIEFSRDPEIAAVTGIYRAQLSPPKGSGMWSRILWRMQRIEFELAGGAALERNLDPLVLSGTCTVFRNDALAAVNVFRGGKGPWATDSLVEDFAITLDLKKLNLKCLVSQNIWTRTDTMPTLRSLWRQRLRWQQGTMLEVRRAGFTPVTRPIVWQLCTSLIACLRYVALVLLAALLFFGNVESEWNRYRVLAYLLVAGVIIFSFYYRLCRRPDLDVADRVTAMSVLPMELYSAFRCAVFIVSGTAVLRGKPRVWR